ncbi:MAG: YkgJ family cysteine cluster protein [Polyangiaceae bacterium]
MPPPTRRIRLPVWDRPELDLPGAAQPGSLLAILPAARKLTQAVMRLSEEREKQAGRKVTCKVGCAACCRHLIPVSRVEAKSLAMLVEKLPTVQREAVKKRFQAALVKLEGAGLLPPKKDAPRTALRTESAGDAAALWDEVSRKYFALQINCPFLEQERCIIYEGRPLLCREHEVTSDPARCKTLDGGAVGVPRPTFPSRALALAAADLDGVSAASIPLVTALEWAADAGDELGSEHGPVALLDAFLDNLTWGEELSEA